MKAINWNKIILTMLETNELIEMYSSLKDKKQNLIELLEDDKTKHKVSIKEIKKEINKRNKIKNE